MGAVSSAGGCSTCPWTPTVEVWTNRDKPARAEASSRHLGAAHVHLAVVGIGVSRRTVDRGHVQQGIDALDQPRRRSDVAQAPLHQGDARSRSAVVTDAGRARAWTEWPWSSSRRSRRPPVYPVAPVSATLTARPDAPRRRTTRGSAPRSREVEAKGGDPHRLRPMPDRRSSSVNSRSRAAVRAIDVSGLHEEARHPVLDHVHDSPRAAAHRGEAAGRRLDQRDPEGLEDRGEREDIRGAQVVLDRVHPPRERDPARSPPRSTRARRSDSTERACPSPEPTSRRWARGLRAAKRANASTRFSRPFPRSNRPV